MRLYVRHVLCRTSTFVKLGLLTAACLMFYAAFRLFESVVKSKTSRHPLPSPCMETDDYGVLRPCGQNVNNDKHRRGGGGDGRWQGGYTPDLGDFDPVKLGAELYVGTYVPPNQRHNPAPDSDNISDGVEKRKKTGIGRKVWWRKTERDEGEIPVVIVEEHHDVIPYWFKAVDQGLLPPEGNVLIHIDAHADVAVPTLNASFPLFRHPHLSELVYLMQRNDMFIAAAALTGFIRRYIWVIPPWDTRLADLVDPSGHSRFHVTAGLLQDIDGEQLKGLHDHKSDNGDPEVCYCVDFTQENQRKRSSQCFVQVRRSELHPFAVSNRIIFREQCQDHVYVVADIVREDKAIELFRSGNEQHDDFATNVKNYPSSSDQKKKTPWLNDEDSIILDIDQDYYGVQSAITPLKAAKINMNILETISEMVSRIFCAHNANQETRADIVFTELVKIMYEDMMLCQQNKNCASESHSPLETFSAKLSRELTHPSVWECVCGQHSRELDTLVPFLIRDLFFLTGPQLRALSQVGICLRESPRTLGFDPSHGMKVCTGHNRPGRSAVVFHLPDNGEVDERTVNLFRLLKSGHLSPRLVTVARSVRDGYTPRQLARRVERDLMYILQSAVPLLSDHAPQYDSQLMGGKAGRGHRY